jgi:hypothetical protein
LLTEYPVDENIPGGQIRRGVVLEQGLIKQGVGTNSIGDVVKIPSVVVYVLKAGCLREN